MRTAHHQRRPIAAVGTPLLFRYLSPVTSILCSGLGLGMRTKSPSSTPIHRRTAHGSRTVPLAMRTAWALCGGGLGDQLNYARVLGGSR
jgi:hypothetical protein